jgi:hypothetical protein
LRSPGDCERRDHMSMTSFENPFQKHERMRHLLDWDEYCERFGDPVYGEINMNWYSPSIYDVYFDDDNVNDDIINNNYNGSDVIDGALVDKLEVECKENMKGVQ